LLIYPFASPAPEPGKVLADRTGCGLDAHAACRSRSTTSTSGASRTTEGWAVVDTGMRTDATLAAWRELFATTTEQRPLTRVFGTHMHPDHVGMAGWLTRKFNCRLWMTPVGVPELPRVLTADTGREAPDRRGRVLPPGRLERGGTGELTGPVLAISGNTHPRVARELPAHRRWGTDPHRSPRLARHRRNRAFPGTRLPLLRRA
jgi:glyoxylase-like metal-dependent hydrolase (beta-lactamase superfamily II)